VCGVACIDIIPQEGLRSAFNKPFSFPCKGHRVVMDGICTEHPHLTVVMDASYPGSLAVRDREIHAEALQRGERDVQGR